jgi:hypothetical protein
MIEVDLAFGGLASVSRLSLLNGANAAAILSDAGIWEVVQFELAEEISRTAGGFQTCCAGRGEPMTPCAKAQVRATGLSSSTVPSCRWG